MGQRGIKTTATREQRAIFKAVCATGLIWLS
jgi:hypothetical protein